MTGKEYHRKIKLGKIAVASCIAALLLFVTIFFSFVPPRRLLIGYSFPEREEGEMRVHFLSLGEGDCTIVEFPSGNVLVVNAGDGSVSDENKLVRYLKGLSFSSLTLAVTRAEERYCGGASELFGLFPVAACYLPLTPSDSAAYRNFLTKAENAGCELRELTRLQTVEDPSGAYAACISPRSVDSGDTGDTAAVLWVSYGSVNVLLSGDVSWEREAFLLRENALDGSIFDRGTHRIRLSETTVFRAPRGGSSKAWLKALNAETVVLSAGDTATPKNLSGADIYRMDELGDVVLKIKDDTYEIDCDFCSRTGGRL